jgi:hypothetical protein
VTADELATAGYSCTEGGEKDEDYQFTRRPDAQQVRPQPDGVSGRYLPTRFQEGVFRVPDDFKRSESPVGQALQL